MGITSFLANIAGGGVKESLEGIGSLAKDIRAAITGKEPIDATKAAELALKAQELENAVEVARTNIIIAEASSSDKWTSRARPSFMYVFYLIIIVLGVLTPMIGIFFPLQMKQFYVNVTEGFKAIPDIAWEVFCIGYLGYTTARQWGKIKGSDK